MPADFLPRTGVYRREARFSNPIGETGERRVRHIVVQDPQRQIAVKLDVDDVEERLVEQLGRTSTTEACVLALSGARAGGFMYVDPSTGSLFEGMSGVPALPAPLVVGFRWAHAAVGGCESWSELAEVSFERLKVRRTTRCKNSETVLEEEWTRGEGRTFLGSASSDWSRTRFERALPPNMSSLREGP
jgi:hypothetical protein